MTKAAETEAAAPAAALVSALPAASAAAAAQRGSHWQVRLLGALHARSGDVRITRWPPASRPRCCWPRWCSSPAERIRVRR